jgi:hypothetical protein
MWLLKRGDDVLAKHPTRRQCIMEAYERGLVVYIGRGKETLVDGVTIEDARV